MKQLYHTRHQDTALATSLRMAECMNELTLYCIGFLPATTAQDLNAHFASKMPEEFTCTSVKVTTSPTHGLRFNRCLCRF